ncbi:unnamed protein product [Nyctereutes procyonoides]|uniref:(raccoon dog) hypothetical protein n=1 Tax=Nyctereutes procyonoides TaxID=34880 RepID=A0A811YC83_NYCPR|nr:unnamed protein product [Nyctereutes procyonoides]
MGQRLPPHKSTPSQSCYRGVQGRTESLARGRRVAATASPTPRRASPRGLPATAPAREGPLPRRPPPPGRHCSCTGPRSRGRPGRRCSCGGSQAPLPQPAALRTREAPPQLHGPGARPAPQLHRPRGGGAGGRGAEPASPHPARPRSCGGPVPAPGLPQLRRPPPPQPLRAHKLNSTRGGAPGPARPPPAPARPGPHSWRPPPARGAGRGGGAGSGAGAGAGTHTERP